ncbi:MAG: DUF222 domain-containing protein, partial [Gemmatimonadetes bacterium]|nr:DUF222 domain-containing protein [Gemmatimonadota bacterium]
MRGDEGMAGLEGLAGRVTGAAPGQGAAATLADASTVEAEARAARVDRVAVLYAQITSATREFLRAVAECDRHGDWSVEGFGSCAEWLAWRVGLQRNAANERVRVARALEHLPQTSEAMAVGELSFSKVRALTRVATPESEGELLELARTGSTAHLERVVRAWKTLTRDGEAKRERVLHRTRRFSVVPDGDGMYVVRGRLTPEVAAVLLRAVEAASDALFEAASEEERGEVDPAQRRVDALGLVAERALAAGMGFEAAPVSGSRAERYQVLLHVERETLKEETEPGMSELEDGTRVSAETARRLACDASVVTVTRGRDDGGVVAASPVLGGGAVAPSPVLDVGRRKRSVTPSLRRALDARDRGCRFPGCGCRFTDAHHIEHWADGGETKLSNLVLLCRRHHRRVHEGGWRVCSDVHGTQIVFFTPAGRALAAAPPLVVA